MFKCQNFSYAVFGNPVNYSKSPEIHSLFSKQTGIFYSYQSVHVPLNQFDFIINNFFKNNGLGANITAPFKQKAYFFSNKVTERAEIAQSVNTLKKIDKNIFLGDNTDGVGLLSDLKRLNFIKKDSSILILGAGGAVKGILFPLLLFGCSVFILNRTLLNAEKLVLQFNKYGKIKVFQENVKTIKHFDLIINATSNFSQEQEKFFPFSRISLSTCFYDMNYQIDKRNFINWCVKIGAKFFSNGIGMLVFQAAHSCFLWHKVLPKTDCIIDLFKNKYN